MATWLDIMPPMPLVRGVPVVVLNGPCWRGTVTYSDGVEWVRVIYADGLGDSLSANRVRADLDEPLGVAHAMRWLAHHGGPNAPLPVGGIVERWLWWEMTDADRLALARACAEMVSDGGGR